MVDANPISIMVWHIQWGLVILLYFSLSGVKIHEPPCKSCKYTKESILMGHTLWYGAGKELASNLTAAWCRDSNTMAGIPCFVQRYTYRVLQTIQMKLIILCVWAERAILGSDKTALKFKYEI